MKREDLIQMANKAGAFTELSATPDKDVAFLERFAALVAAAEREACASVCDAVYEREGAYGSNQAQICADEIRARGKK